MIRWTYRLEFESPLSIFSGLSVAGLVDRIVVRNAGGLPVVPGSTVKGRWRYQAERLLRSLPEKTAAVGGIFPHGEGCDAAAAGSPCTVCQWFGSPSVPAAVKVGPANLLRGKGQNSELDWHGIFSDLVGVPGHPLLRPDAEIRPGIAVSRQFRTVKADHLFFDETVPPVVFEGTILLARAPTEAEERFLRAAAALVDRVGARKAVGRGGLAGGIRIEGGGA